MSPDETDCTPLAEFQRFNQTQETDAHIHGPAATGSNAAVLFPLPLGQLSDFEINLTPQQVTDLKNGLHYVNVHTSMFPNGEIRGQFQSSPSASVVVAGATNVGVKEGQGGVTVLLLLDWAIRRPPPLLAMRRATPPVSRTVMSFNGVASSRCDYAASVGAVTFAAGESFKTISIPIVDDSYAEGTETFTISLSNPNGPASRTTNYNYDYN